MGIEKASLKGKTGQKPQAIMWWNLTQVEREFGVDRATLERRRRELAIKANVEGCYTSRQIAAMMFGDKEAEVIGKTKAEREKTETEVETMRKTRIPLEVHEQVNGEAFGSMAAIIKAHRGKILTDDVISDLQSALRDIPKRLKWTK